MKFIHIADVHLGATPDSGMPWSGEREKEIWRSFENIIEICNEEQADLFLIAGDLFHRQPLLRELKEVNYIFSRLNTTRVVMMAGNHDFMGVRSFYRDFEWNKKVFIFPTDRIGKLVLEEQGVEVYGLSYLTRDITEPLYDEVRPEENDYYQILLAHGGDERDIPMNRRKMQEAGFDYIALGHIHKPEMITDKIAYCGSLEPLDKNETGEHGYMIGEIYNTDLGGRVTKARFVPHSVRQYQRVSLAVNPQITNGALIDMAKEAIHRLGASHIYSFRIQGIRDEAIRFDTAALKSLGCILEVEDQSVPDYDFDGLYGENKDNIIGMFIERIRENKAEDEASRKALYYGIEALLGARN